MSISSVGGQSSVQNLLLNDLKKSGLSSDVAEQVDSEIKSVFDSLSSSGTKASPTDVRSAIEAKLKEDVESGSLSQDQADQVLSALDEFEKQLKQSGGPQGTSGAGGQGPDATELFKKLDSDGDGKVTKDEFVAGRPDNVSEEDAASFYNKIAEESGGDAETGLSEDQFTTGMQKAGPPPGPPPGGGAPPAGASDEEDDDEDDTTSSTSSTTSSSAQSLQDILKALTEGNSDSTDTASYLNKLLSGKLVDTSA